MRSRATRASAGSKIFVAQSVDNIFFAGRVGFFTRAASGDHVSASAAKLLRHSAAQGLKKRQLEQSPL
jgi:hypothetical protein